MPRTTSPVESQAYEPLVPQTKNPVKAKLKTVQMIEAALMELHNVKGVTLRQIYNYVLNTFDLESISNSRASLIKKYLKSLWESEDIANITGRGLIGHFKLVDKKKFARKIINNHKKKSQSFDVKKKSKKNEEVTSKSETKGVKNKVPSSLVEAPPVIPRQVTPIPLRQNNISMFDTPMLPTQVQASTPLIRSLVPRAPEVRRKANRKKLQEDDGGTPRSSQSAKRRKLINRNVK